MYIEEEKGSSKPKIRLKKRGTFAKSGDGVESTVRKQKEAVSQCNNNPLDRFNQLVLDWNVTESKDSQHLPTLPMKYSDYQEYVRSWEPLFIEEVHASVLSSSPVSSFQKKISLCSLQLPSDLHTQRTPLITVPCSLLKEPMGVGNDAKKITSPSLAHMDIVLLSEYSPTLTNSARSKRTEGIPNISRGGFVQVSSHSPELPPSYILGIVSSPPRGNEYSLTLHRQRTIKSRKNSSDVKHSALTYHLKVLTSLNSSWREFIALHEAHRMPLLSMILQPKFSSSNRQAAEKGAVCHRTHENSSRTESSLWIMEGVREGFNAYLHSTFNPSQQQAVRCAVERNEGFSLIQGPPGTGKTTTILGMLNALHIRDYNCYFEKLLQLALGKEGLRCRSSNKGQTHGVVVDVKRWSDLVHGLSSKGCKPHLLVVAPSNVAVDHIVEKVMAKGFKGSTGDSYFPNILRIGSTRSRENKDNRHNDVLSVWLEESVDNLLKEETDESILVLQQNLKECVKEIIHLQTILLNLKFFFDKHPLNKDWELRVSSDNAQPYWVDHKNKITTPQPPIFSSDEEISYPAIDSLPDYVVFSQAFVKLLEHLRVNSLRNARMQAINQHRAVFGDRNYTSLRQTLEASLIEEADIVFSTINSSGSSSLEGSLFPVVICDEAGQCVECSSLIPLRHGAVQCIMVGDHKQLGSTTFSSLSASKGFDISLFERLQIAAEEEIVLGKSCDGSIMLKTQYRMLPNISHFPSQTFYSGLLQDGENVLSPFYAPSFVTSNSDTTDSESGRVGDTFLKPFMYFNLLSSREHFNETSMSLANKEEALLCVNLVQEILVEATRMGCKVGSIGIITPYQDQLSELRMQFLPSNLGIKLKSKFTESKFTESTSIMEDGEIDDGNIGVSVDISDCDVEINTVDAFQGREKDIVIFSCVRANDENNIGFLSDRRRLNVALTRARFGMFVIGNTNTLCESNLWNSLILHATHNDCMVTMRTALDSVRQRVACGAEFYEHDELIVKTSSDCDFQRKRRISSDDDTGSSKRKKKSE